MISVFEQAVLHVVRMRAGEQVIGVDAGWSVTGMADRLALWDGADKEFIDVPG